MNKLPMLVILLVGLSGCLAGQKKTCEKPQVVVSILPVKSFVEKIAGDDFDIILLIPHGANPATYSLSPSQMRGISRAAAWFRMGYIGFELSWYGRISETYPALKIVDLSEGLDLISRNPEENQPFHAGVDPHTWLSPTRVKIMSDRIFRELTRMNPGKEDLYRENYQKFLDEIVRTDREIRAILQKAPGRKFISYHPSLSYFARDYGLIQLSMEEGGKEPTPARLAVIAETAKQEGIKAVFIQSDFDKEFASAFAGEIGAKIIQIWPLNPDWSENLLTIARLLSD